jgi:hypothetical protein
MNGTRTAVAVAAALVVTACGGSGGTPGGQDTPPPPPPAPAAVAIRPADGAAVVTWTPSPGATSYKVYSGAASALTTASPRVASVDPSVAVSGLTNGTPRFFAVSAVGPGGESALTKVRCAVPTAANLTYGGEDLALYDGLCADRLNGAQWDDPGAWSVAVMGGQAALSADADDMEPNAVRNAFSAATATVAASRVTTLSSLVKVPAATASRTGRAALRATVRLMYQPPALRIQAPAANQDLLVIEAGLQDLGSGLQAIRRIYHCDDAVCASPSDADIAFSTDPVGFTTVSAAAKGAPASYDTAYRVTVQLDEATGLFQWSISGGPEFATTVSGAADPAAYLAATASWAGIPLAGVGFEAGQLQARVHDRSLTGGGSARITALFDDVRVGLDGAAEAAWDDFSGAGGNSGPADLSLARWNVGSRRVGPSGNGDVSLSNRAASAGTAVTLSNPLLLANPEAASIVQAEIAMPALVGTTAGVSGTVRLDGRFHNDGTGTVTGSAVGDIYAAVDVTQNAAGASGRYIIYRCTSADCSGTATLAGAPLPVALSAPIPSLPVRVGYDGYADEFVFGLATVTVRLPAPAGAAYVAPARAPQRRINTRLALPATAGVQGSLDVRVRNVFAGYVRGPAVEACSGLDPALSTSVAVVDVASDAPAATGGTIQSGTYRLTATNVYTGAGGASGPEGMTWKMAWSFSGSSMQMAMRLEDGGGEKHAGHFGVQGSKLVVVESCPVTGARQFRYTASGNELKVYEPWNGSSGGTAEYVLTRQ